MMTPLVKVQGAVFAEPFSNPGLPRICVVVPPLVDTVKEMVVLCETPPPLALIVTVEVPVVAVLLAVNVSVELPEPGAAIDVGLKLAVTPAGSPLAESDTAELKPPETVVETVVRRRTIKRPGFSTLATRAPVTWCHASRQAS